MGVQPTRKGKGKGKQVERQGARHSREQKPDEEFWQGKEEHIQGSRCRTGYRCCDFQITRRHIYYYNHATRCVDQPCQHFGQCYGFLQGSILVAFGVANLRQTWTIFKASLNVFANRNRWRWFFRDTPRQQFSICVPPHGKTRVCTHPAAPSLDTWISKFKRCLTEVSVKSFRTASRDRSFCNKIPLVNFGLEFLSQSGLEAVVNDKDGVTPSLILKC